MKSLAQLLVAIACVIASIAFLLRSTGPAQAEIGPSSTGGGAPWLSFAGSTSDPTDHVIYSVPADRVFIVTAVCTSFSGHSLYENATLKVPGSARAMECAGGGFSGGSGFLAQGQGSIPFGPGTDVILRSTSTSTYSYVIQGYLAAP